MKLTFATNLVHHHQIPVADEFYKLLGNDFRYIATEEMPDWLIKGGYDPTLDRPYIIRSYQTPQNMAEARCLIDESDVVICGAVPSSWTLKRKEANKITFVYSERWLKKLDIHCISPKGLFFIYKDYYRFRNKRLYMLCASAYASHDVQLYGCFPNRCYKWGYFTKVDMEFDVKSTLDKCPPKSARLMWCARFLDWKHPELPVLLADKLRKEGYRFILDMYGSGEFLEKTKQLALKLNLMGMISFCGNKPNDQLLNEMRCHDIFLFTSDRNEGWGAVLNEAMSNGCAVVASHMIGAAPYLIEDGVNGLLFKSENLESLYLQVKRLLDNNEYRNNISSNAVKTMQEVWNPSIAAKRFILLLERLVNGYDTDFVEGPCSKA